MTWSGIDTSFYAGRVMWEAFPDRITASPILPADESRPLGSKVGRGLLRVQGYAGPRRIRPGLDKTHRSVSFAATRQFTHRMKSASYVLADGARSHPDSRSKPGARRARRGSGRDFRPGFPAIPRRTAFLGRMLGAAKIIEMLEPWHPRRSNAADADAVEMAKHRPKILRRGASLAMSRSEYGRDCPTFAQSSEQIWTFLFSPPYSAIMKNAVIIAGVRTPIGCR